MHLWSKIEDSTSCGYLGTALNTTGECLPTRTKAPAHADAHEGYCTSPSLLREFALKWMLKIHKHLISIQLETTISFNVFEEAATLVDILRIFRRWTNLPRPYRAVNLHSWPKRHWIYKRQICTIEYYRSWAFGKYIPLACYSKQGNAIPKVYRCKKVTYVVQDQFFFSIFDMRFPIAIVFSSVSLTLLMFQLLYKLSP